MAKQEKRPQDWTREQKLNALLETSSLSQEKLGAWCRQHGLHTHHLDQWRRELAQEPAASDKTSLKKAHQQNKKLKQELRRKDKALAETSALLVLKKKANAIWGESEDD